MKPTSRLWACYGAMVCVAIAVNLPPVYLTTFSETFGGSAGLTAEQMGRIPAIVFAGLVLGIVFSGPLADRWGGKAFAMLGLSLTSCGLVVMGLAGSYPALLVASALMGLGAGVLDMVLSPIVCALEPSRRASAMNWLHSFYCTGAVATVLVGASGLEASVPWRGVVLCSAAFPALVFAGFARMRVPSLVAESRAREPVRALAKSAFFVAVLAAMFLSGATEAGMSQWLPAFAERALGLAKSASSFALAGFLLAMAAGRIGVALMGERARPLQLLLACAAASVALYLAGSFVPARGVALAACIAFGLSVSCLWPTILALAANRFPGGGASMFATLSAFGNAGCFLMPWVIGVVAQGSGLRVGLGSSALAPAALVLVLLLLARQSRRAKAV
jgi:fucose permease